MAVPASCCARWILREDLAVKDFSQPGTVQRKGLSLVLRFQRRCECSWERMCLVRLPDCRNFFPQPGYLQGNGRSPVWIRTCCTRLDDCGGDGVGGCERLSG